MRYPKRFRLKIFRRISLTYLFIVLLSVSCITALLYGLFAARTTQESIRLSLAMLTQTAHSVSFVNEQVRYVADQLITTPEAVSILFARRVDYYQDYLARLKVQILQDAHPFIDNIGLYNRVISRYWNTRLLLPQDEQELIARIRVGAGTAYVDCCPRVIVDSTNEARRTTNVISFVLTPNLRYTPEGRTAIVVNVSESYLSAVLRGMSVEPDERLLIIDAAGRVIAGKEPGAFLRDESGTTYFTAIVEGAQAQGSLTAHVGGKRCLVTWVTEETTNWRVVSIRPVSSLTPGLDTLRRTTFLLAFLILGVGSVLSLMAARFVYSPIDALVSRILSLPGSDAQTIDEVSLINSALDQTKRLCLTYLLLGRAPEEAPLATLLASYAEDFASSHFRVCIVKIDGYAPYCAAHGAESRDAHQAVLRDAAASAFPVGFDAQVTVMEENETVILLGFRGENELPAIRQGLELIRGKMREQCRLSLSAGIGCVANDTKAISTSYHSARGAASHRFLMGKGAVIDETQIGSREISGGQYPKGLEARLIEALSIEQTDEALGYLESLRKCISGMPLDRAIGHSTTLAFSLETHFTPLLGAAWAPDAPDPSSCETLDEVMDALRRYCRDITAGIREHNAKRGDETVARMKHHVQERYADPALNLGTVAGMVSLSPTYVGKLFKRSTGSSFASHLNGVRMEKARELLESTDLSIGAIATRIGLSNATYLFTLFKKTYAETPQRYRERHSASAEQAAGKRRT